MANSWYHAFHAQFSWEVAVIAIAVLAAVYLIGRKSVHIVPMRKRKSSANGAQTLPENAPRYIKAKVAQAKKVTMGAYRKAARKSELRRCDSVIMFHSATFDRVIAAIAAIVFVAVFAKEHWTGLVQFWINSLSANGSAAWGDIIAANCVGVLGMAYAYLAYGLVRVGQIHTAAVLGERYLTRGVAPCCRRESCSKSAHCYNSGRPDCHHRISDTCNESELLRKVRSLMAGLFPCSKTCAKMKIWNRPSSFMT